MTSTEVLMAISQRRDEKKKESKKKEEGEEKGRKAKVDHSACNERDFEQYIE